MDSKTDPERADYIDDRPTDDLTDWSNDYEDPRLKKIKRTVDLRLSVILAIMYIVNQIDRTNLPMA